MMTTRGPTMRPMKFLLALGFLVCSQAAFAQGNLPPAFSKKIPTSLQDLQDIETHVHKLVDQVMPCVVCLRIGNAQGSGVIIDRAGHVLTAGHVSGEANRDAVIILADGGRLTGNTLGPNKSLDSRMVRIP